MGGASTLYLALYIISYMYQTGPTDYLMLGLGNGQTDHTEINFISTPLTEILRYLWS
jgi:hypothetical protein